MGMLLRLAVIRTCGKDRTLFTWHAGKVLCLMVYVKRVEVGSKCFVAKAQRLHMSSTCPGKSVKK